MVDFKKAGFREYKNNSKGQSSFLSHKYAETLWQKNIADEKGIKYFINLYVYSAFFYKGEKKMDASIQMNINFSSKSGSPLEIAKNYSFDDVDVLKKIEYEAEEFWEFAIQCSSPACYYDEF